MILLSKVGFNAVDVWDMPAIEVAAWVDSYLVSQGVKKQQQDSQNTTYILKRRKKEGA